MNSLPKTAPLGALGLPSGDHWVRFHVDGDSITFEVTASAPGHGEVPQRRSPTDFVKTWGGTAKRIEDADDAWLTRINEKHLR